MQISIDCVKLVHRAKTITALALFFSAGAFLNGQTPRPQGRGFAGGGRNYPPTDAEAVERGHKQFVATCAFCHGSNAKGGESGPDLLRSVVVLDDDHGDKIGPVVLNGRPDKGMPKFSLTPAQISDISAFLLDRVKAAALRGTYQILNIVTGDPKAGEIYFNGAGRCATCHSVTGDLAHIGSKYDPVTIQQLLVMPRERRGGFMQPPQTSSQPVTVTVTPKSRPIFHGNARAYRRFLRVAHGFQWRVPFLHAQRRRSEGPNSRSHSSSHAKCF